MNGLGTIAAWICSTHCSGVTVRRASNTPASISVFEGWLVDMMGVEEDSDELQSLYERAVLADARIEGSGTGMVSNVESDDACRRAHRECRKVLL